MSKLCTVCVAKVTAKSPGVLCSGPCGQYFHGRCANISSDALKALNGIIGAQWFCNTCRTSNHNNSVIIDNEEAKSSSTDSTQQPSIIEAIENLRLDFNNKYEEMKRLILEKNSEIKNLSDENTLLKGEIVNLSSRLDNLEQYSRRNNLEIHGVPEVEQENLLKTINEIGNVLDCPVSSDDVDTLHRVPYFNKKKDIPRNIIIKFKSRLFKNKFLESAKNFQKVNRKKAIEIPNVPSKIYINEHLTPKNKKLFNSTKLFCKEKNIQYFWVKDCKILARKNSSSQIIQIFDEESLSKLI